MTTTALARELTRLLELDHPPVAVTFHERVPAEGSHSRPAPEPAGCCFWARAEDQRLLTTAADHAHCSVGSYTHGMVSLADAAAAEDTATLVDSGWVTKSDLTRTATVKTTPVAITYEPLAGVDEADVVLVRLNARSLMSLQGACPELTMVTKPQCQIVPLARVRVIAVSPGCAVSRSRTGLPADELTCAFPVRKLREVVARLTRSTAADATVGAYADADIEQNFARA